MFRSFEIFSSEKFQNYEILKGGCVRSKNKFKTQKNKLRLLATDINLNCYKLGVLSLMVRRLYCNLNSIQWSILVHDLLTIGI